MSWSRQLHHDLLAAKRPTASHRPIIPEEAVRAIVTIERVRGLLVNELHVEAMLVEPHAAVVADQAAKVLAILVCIGRTSALLDCFIFPGLGDAQLPLSSSDLPPSFAHQFVAEQHHFIAPVFVLGLFADWKPETVLPFVLDEPIGAADGGFSTLYKIEIMPSFQRLVPPGSQTIVRVSHPGQHVPCC
jgi:hypothetical protein